MISVDTSERDLEQLRSQLQSRLQGRRVAVVHDWLTGMRGGEFVLEAILELFPEAEIFTLIAVPGKYSNTIARHRIHTSFLQRIPQIEKRYRHFLALMPWAVAQWDFSDFDVIVSSSHCVAKGIRKPRTALHFSYIHAPMRYMWDRFEDYFGPGKARGWVRLVARLLRPFLRAWDRRVSSRERVDYCVANSHFIQQQVQRAYGREDCGVIFPFVDLRRFATSPSQNTTSPAALAVERVAAIGAAKNTREDFYLMVGAFAPYKRVDLALQAFVEMKLPLWIVGDGQEAKTLREQYAERAPWIRFLGYQSDVAIADLYQRCRAFVFPGKEDFGITPLEAMAFGAPVVAFGEGGVLDTVKEGETGIFFYTQDVAALKQAVLRLEGDLRTPFSADVLRRQADAFSKERFQRSFAGWVLAGMNSWFKK